MVLGTQDRCRDQCREHCRSSGNPSASCAQRIFNPKLPHVPSPQVQMCLMLHLCPKHASLAWGVCIRLDVTMSMPSNLHSDAASKAQCVTRRAIPQDTSRKMGLGEALAIIVSALPLGSTNGARLSCTCHSRPYASGEEAEPWNSLEMS